MFTFVVWKWKARCLGFDSCFLNLWPKFSDYVVTGRIIVILTCLPYLALGTELGWFVNNQWTLGLELSVRMFANKLYSQLIFNQSGGLPLASQPARWERTRCRLCSLRSLPPPPSLSPWRRGTQSCRCKLSHRCADHPQHLLGPIHLTFFHPVRLASSPTVIKPRMSS